MVSRKWMTISAVLQATHLFRQRLIVPFSEAVYRQIEVRTNILGTRKRVDNSKGSLH